MAKKAQNPQQAQGEQLIQKCIYCCIRPAVNKEDVVAKGFFGKPRPRNPVKVPSCRECNAGRGDGGSRPLSEDEEYTRIVFCADEAGGGHPVAMSLVAGEISRSLDYSPKLRSMMAANLGLVTGRTSAGILVPNLPAINIRRDRVYRVLRKITRGMFYAATDQPLPPDWEVTVSERLDQKQFEQTRNGIDSLRVRTGWHGIGDTGVFCCSGGKEDPNSYQSVWLLLFYQKIAFATATAPPGSRA